MWKWGEDKFKTGYKLFTIFYSKLLGIDIYLFHYPQGSFIPKHKDPGKSGAHYRFNIELVAAKKGGVFICENKILALFSRIYLFRADTNYHQVSVIEEGCRIVLSFGWTNKFDKP